MSVALGCLLLAARSHALPGEALHSISLDESLSTARDKFSANAQRTGQSVATLSAVAAQQYADGLLRSDFLAALNRAGAKHSLLVDAAARHVSFLRADVGASRAVLGFADDKLEAAFVKLAVTPDTAAGGGENAFTAARLAPIHQVLAGLRAEGCSLQAKSERRNAFIHQGTCQGAGVYVEYRPEQDQFWIVYWKR